MKLSSLKTGTLLLLFLLAFTQVDAQRSSKQDVDAALDDSSKLQGLTVGSYISFGYANGWQLDFSPGVGYKVFDFMIVGAGINYAYSEQFFNGSSNAKQTASSFGPRAYAQFNIYSSFYGMSEFQKLYYSFKIKDDAGNVTQEGNANENVLFLGAGYSSSFGQGFGIYTEFLIDVLYDRLNSPRVAPYTVRFGLFYTF